MWVYQSAMRQANNLGYVMRWHRSLDGDAGERTQRSAYLIVAQQITGGGRAGKATIELINDDPTIGRGFALDIQGATPSCLSKCPGTAQPQRLDIRCILECYAFAFAEHHLVSGHKGLTYSTLRRDENLNGVFKSLQGMKERHTFAGDIACIIEYWCRIAKVFLQKVRTMFAATDQLLVVEDQEHAS